MALTSFLLQRQGVSPPRAVRALGWPRRPRVDLGPGRVLRALLHAHRVPTQHPTCSAFCSGTGTSSSVNPSLPPPRHSAQVSAMARAL